MANVCTIKKAARLTQDFVATVVIPIGFKLVDNGVDPVNPYQCYMSFDKNSIISTVAHQLFSSVITIPDLDNPGQMTTIDCMSKINEVTLTGPLFYNAIISGFEPVSALTPVTTSLSVVTAPTAFSNSETIEVQRIVAYGCHECDFPDNIMSSFEISIVQHEEFLVNNHGNIIFNRPPSTQEFFDALKEGDVSQVIHIPFTLVMSSII